MKAATLSRLTSPYDQRRLRGDPTGAGLVGQGARVGR